MAEAQAVDRVHRIGQTRDVLVTRYIMSDSIETVSHNNMAVFHTNLAWTDSIQYIQWIQQDKIRLINRSLDFAEVSQSSVDDERWKVCFLLFQTN
jgi:hypothetical protein